MLRFCIFGSSGIYDVGLEERLRAELEIIAAKDDEIEFWITKADELVLLCLRQVGIIRTKYPEKEVRIVYVHDPIRGVKQEDSTWYDNMYRIGIPQYFIDRDIYAPLLDGKTGRDSKLYTAQSNKVERWIFKQCDYVLSYVYPNLPSSEISQLNYAKNSAQIVSLISEDTSAFIEEKIKELDERPRFIIESLNAGLTQKQIAQELGITSSAVQQKSHYEARQIKKTMGSRFRKQCAGFSPPARICALAAPGEPTVMKLTAFDGLIEGLIKNHGVNEFWVAQDCCDSAYAAILAKPVYRSRGEITMKAVTHYPAEDATESVLNTYRPVFHEIINIPPEKTCDDLYVPSFKLMTDYAMCFLTDLSGDAEYIETIKRMCARSGNTWLIDLSRYRSDIDQPI